MYQYGVQHYIYNANTVYPYSILTACLLSGPGFHMMCNIMDMGAMTALEGCPFDAIRKDQTDD